MKPSDYDGRGSEPPYETPDLARCAACGELRPTPPAGLFGTNDVVCPHCGECYAVEPPAPVPPDLDDRTPQSLHDSIPLAPPGFGTGPVIEHAATDLETFRAFFDSLGVPYVPVIGSNMLEDGETSLVVSGACFVFDNAGRFDSVIHAWTFRRVARKS